MYLPLIKLPHLLFHGPPGTGKTSAILALAHELYGPELYKFRVLELNASDDRGIQVIREKVKNFAKATANRTVSGYPCPPFKIVILDEADSMTIDAQSALRRMMETYSTVTRFCIISNYVSKIIEPIASRCAKFRFNCLQKEDIFAKLEAICYAEKIQVVDQQRVFDEIVKIAEGDLRRAIMFLQSVCSLSKRLTMDSVRSVSELIPDEINEAFLDVCKKGPFSKIQEIVSDEIISNAYAASQFLLQFSAFLADTAAAGSVEKAFIAVKIGLVEKQLVQGADEYLQLMDLGSFIHELLFHKKKINLMEIAFK